MKSKNKSYSEILAFLEIIDDEYVKKIPNKLIEIFKNGRDEEYVPKYNLEIPIEEQSFMKETLELIAILYLNYWYETEEDKKDLEKMYSKNTFKKEQELREKYNPDNIFKPKEKIEHKEVLAIVEYKESILKKILSKIKNLVKRKI